jgi:hypothetical protein
MDRRSLPCILLYTFFSVLGGILRERPQRGRPVSGKPFLTQATHLSDNMKPLAQAISGNWHTRATILVLSASLLSLAGIVLAKSKDCALMAVCRSHCDLFADMLTSPCSQHLSLQRQFYRNFCNTLLSIAVSAAAAASAAATAAHLTV